MSKILLTGGTGFVGSSIAIKLIEEGNNELFCLARGKAGLSAKERVFKILTEIKPNISLNKVKILEGDITVPNLGLSLTDTKTIIDIDEIFHSAGSVFFSEKNRKDTMLINDIGTKNVLALASQLKIKQFHFISTAYVCGDMRGVIPEKPLKGQKFFNPYQESKYLAECRVIKWFLKNKVDLKIFRPSIIIGHSETGFTIGFDGFYNFMRAISIISRKLKRSKMKFNHDKDGNIIVPISVSGQAGARLNMIPINYAVGKMMLIRANGSSGIYHITAEKPATYGWWLEEGLKFFGISGTELKDNNSISKNSMWKRWEIMLNEKIKDYIPFITYQPEFSVQNVKKILGERFSDIPVTSKFLHRLLQYATENNFGK